MFVRPCWKPQDIEEAYRLIESYPWAMLVNNGDQGPWATNLPLVLDRSRGQNGVLVGHIARANHHTQALLSATVPTLAVFQGPYSYVTPSWYPARDMPGTYYYTAVHCYGNIRRQEDDELENAITAMSDRMEASVAGGWSTSEIPHTEITRRLPSIIGFELEIERIEGKFKLGQDEPKKDALAVAAHLAASGDPWQSELAKMVEASNAGRQDDEPR